LFKRGVQMIPQAHRSVGLALFGTLDRGNAIQPYPGGNVGYGLSTGLGGGFGRPFRVNIELGADIGVIHMLPCNRVIGLVIGRIIDRIIGRVIR
jgi:hypothetical protein